MGEQTDKVVASIPSRETDAEWALRDLAAYVGAGGYNAGTVDPAVFFDKIKWGIDHLTNRDDIQRDAARYRKLREVGAAPGGSLHLERGNVLVTTNLDTYLDDFFARGVRPAPSEAVEFGERYSK